MSSKWFYRRGALARDGWETVVDASLAGWQHTGLRIGDLADGERFDLLGGDIERMVLLLSGSELVVEHDGGREVLSGRKSVFHGPADVAYIGVGTNATVSGAGRVAVAEAPAKRRIGVQVMRAADVPVEIRGAGRSTRQVHNFGVPGGLEAEKLIVCEVLTPAENWSSFPAHKHDETVPGVESALEEIYYFESAVARGVRGAAGAEPFGMFGTYSSPEHEIAIDELVRSGDVALVPFGYHGPAVAAPGYDLYYLNVMAGPGPERAWRITDDPAHGWIRSTWEGQPPDPRLPYATDAESEGQK